MSSSHPPQYSYLPPPMQDAVRLPSIKDLNFPPPGQDGGPTNGSGRVEHQRTRHETTSWSRSNAPSGPPPPSHPSHSSNMPPPHDPPPKGHSYSPHNSKHDASYSSSGPGPSPQQSPAGVAMHNGVNGGPARPEQSTDPSSKRSRSQAGVGASPARSPHAPPQGYHQGPPLPAPPPHEQLQQQPAISGPPPGYAPYPPPPMPPRHYGMPPPPPPGLHPAQTQPPPPEHWQHAPSQPPPPHQPQHFNGFARTTHLIPANVETRPPVSTPADAERANARQHVISEILKHCGVLYGFANHYTHTATTHPQIQPTPPEIEDMNNRASIVMRLLDDLRRLDAGEDLSRNESVSGAATPAEEHPRPPKRPWEDMARDGEPSASANYSDAAGHMPHSIDSQAQSTAEQDMQIIRNKRQSSAAGAQTGQQKNKYRKRSRATPPGKCHSCNIRETPEWRRGPDGARTLCNACGLHYAKLMRKREKALDANGKAPPIDLQTLRASTASARGSGGSNGNEHGGDPSPHQGPPPSPYDQPKQPPMHPSPPHSHQGPYQLMPVGPPGPSGQIMAPPATHVSAPHGTNGASAPSWLGSERGGYNPEPQSYMRASHPPSHARASPQ
ncbi:hypothetical protein BN946_scf184754.g8 [Trametes cinnabarina]|uniref:GATA-type domain-containing protein n=1 Tax=Pycnoporus cinnabarinus TaxID=5643 RepID=A0A060S873_PYCCI|nr:hypothetical protein BN946_scf184754.g8 [Trametes cinnabarina]